VLRFGKYFTSSGSIFTGKLARIRGRRWPTRYRVTLKRIYLISLIALNPRVNCSHRRLTTRARLTIVTIVRFQVISRRPKTENIFGVLARVCSNRAESNRIDSHERVSIYEHCCVASCVYRANEQKQCSFCHLVPRDSRGTALWIYH